MPQAAPDAAKLDEYLTDVVRALHGAVKQGVSHAQEPKLLDGAIRDCQEILDVIMEGDVQEWIQ